MPKFSLTCFGVGDGWPCTDRNHAAFLYRFGTATILLDCGEPIGNSFKASGLSYDLIDQILISHLHADHISGLFMLMQGFWLERRRKSLSIRLPRDGVKPLRQMLRTTMLFDELLGFRLRFLLLQNRRHFTVRHVCVTPFNTTHLNRMRKTLRKKYPFRFEAFSFLFEAGDLRIAHSADLGKPEDLAPLLEKPLDLLVCEIAHFTPQDIFEYLRGCDIRRVIFVHLARPLWENLAQVRRRAARTLDMPFTFAHDREQVSL